MLPCRAGPDIDVRAPSVVQRRQQVHHAPARAWGASAGGAGTSRPPVGGCAPGATTPWSRGSR
jgi:hypothetical protein